MTPKTPSRLPGRRRQIVAGLALAQMLAWAQSSSLVDAAALARATIAEGKVPDPGGEVARKLADAVRALPPWAPFYPAAALGLDSGHVGHGHVQVGFSTRDSEEKVARFYLDRFKSRGKTTELQEAGVRTIEVSNSKGDQITTVVLQPGAAGRVSGTIRHEGGC